jgi:hypothetical protein
MAPPKSMVNMPGVAPGKALAGIPVGDETAEQRVHALLMGSVTEDTYQVSCFWYLYLLVKPAVTFLLMVLALFIQEIQSRRRY